MRLRSALAAALATTVLAVAPAAFATTFPANPAIQEVSADADIALWCASTYVVVSQMGGLDDAASATANAFADVAFGKANRILVADGIAESEHDRLISYYIEEAIHGVTGQLPELRYNDQVCHGLVS
ncbi:MAG: hypothetical protein P0Y65_07850 [Candidatus Devosia phytovorans]|uniref:Uncharacterized protein n=1 Tax=Candidatus Devosia phytovorans TaxID=3121372 RepID=A0AAJ5VZ43_9HYPH|nr:hypothetical protein [Devosia sp.]WEK06153.1 MAG: hypothetical protein P0Y65_07850 [Devosia sp.]